MKRPKTAKGMKPTAKPLKLTKRRAGQPTLYRPEYCEKLVQHSRKLGGTFIAFANKLDVTVDCLHDWARAHKEFFLAKKKAKQIQEEVMTNLGLQGIGNKIPYFGHSTYIFMMKAKHGWREDGPMDEQEDNDLEFDLD